MMCLLAETITGQPLLDWVMNLGVTGFALWLFYRLMLKQMEMKGTGRDTKGYSVAVVQIKDDVHEIKGVVYEVRNKVNDLYEMHDQKDEDGVPVWYIRKSLVDTINGLSELISRSTEVMVDLSNSMKDSHKIHEANQKDIREIKKVVKKT